MAPCLNPCFLSVFIIITKISFAQELTINGQPAQLNIYKAGAHSIRVTLKPVDYKKDFPFTPALVERNYGSASLSLKSISKPVKKQVGAMTIEIKPSPLSIIVLNNKGQPVQEISFSKEGNLLFRIGDQPVLGLGEGGSKPEPGVNWRNLPVEFDRRGIFDKMQP